MSRFNCWDCGEEKHCSELFGIPVFSGSDMIYWCFDCANKQLMVSDYQIVKLTKQQTKKKFRIMKFKTMDGWVSFRVRKAKKEVLK